jgi:hypothetical protein
MALLCNLGSADGEATKSYMNLTVKPARKSVLKVTGRGVEHLGESTEIPIGGTRIELAFESGCWIQRNVTDNKEIPILMPWEFLKAKEFENKTFNDLSEVHRRFKTKGVEILKQLESAIGIGRSLAVPPSHTTQHTGPYCANSEVCWLGVLRNGRTIMWPFSKKKKVQKRSHQSVSRVGSGSVRVSSMDFFGSYSESKNGEFLVGWSDSDRESGVGGFRQSGEGSYILAEHGEV